jgi:endonuclease/exonuclease/phosphatase family metal-dependent hydrolase
VTTRASLRCLVLNAGGTYGKDKQAAEQWALEAASAKDRPDLVFIQEVPSDAWLDRWCAQDYRPMLGQARGWKVRSAILTLLDDQTCASLSAEDVPELDYHGEYVAAARLVGWGAGGDLTVFSVHASPSPTTAEYLSHHPAPGRLRPRDGGSDARYGGKLFDSDVVLDTVSQYGPDVLACGDLNEARGWDDTPGHEGHTWGREYFGKLDEAGRLSDGAVQVAQLVDVPLGNGTEEVVTRRAAGHPPLQLDHLLAGREMARRISDVTVHPAWAAEGPLPAGLADHAPIWFRLSR